MRVRELRELIARIQPKVGLTFKLVVEKEFPRLLDRMDDDDIIPLSFWQIHCQSLIMNNMFGAFSSLRHDPKLRRVDKKLLEELLATIRLIQKEFPDITGFTGSSEILDLMFPGRSGHHKKRDGGASGVAISDARESKDLTRRDIGSAVGRGGRKHESQEPTPVGRNVEGEISEGEVKELEEKNIHGSRMKK